MLRASLHTYYDVSSQLTETASFAEDLGLDSLDAVEVVMAVEEVCFLRHCIATGVLKFL